MHNARPTRPTRGSGGSARAAQARRSTSRPLRDARLARVPYLDRRMLVDACDLEAPHDRRRRIEKDHRTIAARSCEGEECVQAGAVHEDEPREIESQHLSRRELTDCLRESRRRGEVQLSRQPNTTRMGERRNVKAGHHGSYIPRYRSMYARSPALRVCSRVRLSACLTQTSTMPNVAASTPATRFPRRHRSDEGELELDELDRFPESSPRLRVPTFAVAITTWSTALFLVADERIYDWSSWPL